MVQAGAKSEIFFSSDQPTPLIQLILEHRSTILDQKISVLKSLISNGVWSHSVPISLWNTRYHSYFHFPYDFFEIRSRFLEKLEGYLNWCQLRQLAPVPTNESEISTTNGGTKNQYSKIIII